MSVNFFLLTVIVITQNKPKSVLRFRLTVPGADLHNSRAGSIVVQMFGVIAIFIPLK